MLLNLYIVILIEEILLIKGRGIRVKILKVHTAIRVSDNEFPLGLKQKHSRKSDITEKHQ